MDNANIQHTIDRAKFAPDEYKRTSLGNIPNEWVIKKLGDFLDYIQPTNYLNDDIVDLKDEVNIIPVLTAGKSFVLGYTIDDEKTFSNIPIILFDDFTTENKYVDFPFKVRSSAAKILIAKNDLFNFKFMYEAMQIINFVSTDHKRYWISEYQNLKLPIPPLPEQKKIAEILSTWDDVIAKCKGIIENLLVRNIGLEQQLLSGKMRLKGYEKSQWHLKSVEEVAVFRNGKAHENSIDEEGDYFVVNSKFISTQGKVAKASNENLCPLFKNDITMVMSDIPNGKALAKCFYIPEDDKYTLNQRICALTAKNGTDSKFLYYQINRNNYYLAFNNGVSQTNLKKEEVLECPLLMPDIEEQTQIVKVLETADQELKSYETKLEALQLQKKGLMQQLLTGKIRVNVK